MKIYLKPPKVASPSLKRVSDALVRYMPEVYKSDFEIVHTKEEADLVILHVIGRQDQVCKEAEELHSAGKQYAVIQYAIRSTQRPHTSGWEKLWRNSKITWSYYDLPYLCQEDGVNFWFPFYYSPLGVDQSVFWSPYTRHELTIMTSGQSYLTESVRECVLADRETLNKGVLHLGNDIGRGVECVSGVSDRELAILYSTCMYVSGLRRVEGFELPAAEGLLCGSRPILFDRPHYRQWFSNFAIFIPEGPREEVLESLKKVFSSQYIPVIQEEIVSARKIFNWETIIKGFWERVLT